MALRTQDSSEGDTHEYLVCPTDRHSDQSGFGDHRLRKRFEPLLNCGRPACFLLNPGNNGFPLTQTIWFGSLSLSVDPVYQSVDEDMTLALWVSGILLFGAILMFYADKDITEHRAMLMW